ncbi:MAG: 4-demethylwyosine synthase TYW1 [Candidatus ainarchaeum sp.]|nr:4-demethylwyosine synthase TYW1 [Candidatus ainarchaeum sp.]MDD3975672.1 4-demethylwyosine synthase TYW1 [Candidatus ainarchaeum sp.]
MDKEKIFKDLKKKQYGIFGDHSAVEICEWNKKALRGEGVCYKQKFYNADCHRCAQITPAVIWCHQNCIFCWRPANYMKEHILKGKINEPKEIIDNLFEERKKLLNGFGGNPKVDKEFYKEALIPSHVAISLAGEPTIYPKIGELINELKSREEIKTIFLVTNGLEPKRLKELNDKNNLPTQLYLSIEACNYDMHLKINRPKIKDSWQRLNETIKLMPILNCRRVVRFTLIKGLNDSLEYIDDFLKMFEETQTDFIEIKSYMFLGESRENLKKENMPTHTEVENYAKEIEKRSENYSVIDRQVASRIVLLKNKNSKYRNFIKD